MSPLNQGSHLDASAPAWQRERRIMMVGLLSPSLQKQITRRAGLPMHLDADALHELPLLWRDQLKVLGC